MTDIDLDAIRARARVIDPCLLDDVPLTLAESAAIAYAPHDIDALCDEVERLRTATSAVRRLHQPVTDWHSGVVARQECNVCLNSTGMRDKYPCPTIRALDAEV